MKHEDARHSVKKEQAEEKFVESKSVAHDDTSSTYSSKQNYEYKAKKKWYD